MNHFLHYLGAIEDVDARALSEPEGAAHRQRHVDTRLDARLVEEGAMGAAAVVKVGGLQ